MTRQMKISSELTCDQISQKHRPLPKQPHPLFPDRWQYQIPPPHEPGPYYNDICFVPIKRTTETTSISHHQTERTLGQQSQQSTDRGGCPTIHDRSLRGVGQVHHESLLRSESACHESCVQEQSCSGCEEIPLISLGCSVTTCHRLAKSPGFQCWGVPSHVGVVCRRACYSYVRPF